MHPFEMTRALIDMESITENEKQVGEYLLHYLSGLAAGSDGKAEAMPVTPERFNVYAEWGRPVVVLSTHMDTVPPFIESREDDDHIYGRGACDAKGIIAAMIAAAEKLIESGTRNFGLLFVVGEERNSAGAEVASRSPRGSRYLINGEPTESKVALGSKGILRYEIVATGKMAHSAYPELGESAIEKLLDALDAIRRMPLPEDPVLGRTTVNIGTISGGRAPNIMPDAAKAELAIRIVGDGRKIDQALRGCGRRSRGGSRNSDASGDAFCVARWISDVGGGVHHRYSRAGAGVGRAIFVWAGQHSRGAHHGGKDFEARIARRGRYLCANDPDAAEAGRKRNMPKNLAIVGYGKMGRLIEQLAPEAGFSVGLKLDIDTNVDQQGITPENFRGVDVAIEFSTPQVAVANLERLCAIGVPTVVGTTGWYGELERVRAFVDKEQRGRGLERELFDRRECFPPGGRRSGAAAGERIRIRRLGLGSPSLGEERRAFGHAASTRRGNEARGIFAAHRCKLEPRGRESGHARNWI